MQGFITQFEIPGPVSFKEKGCDLEFQISVKGGLYVDFYDETAFGETRNEQIVNMKKMAADKVLDDLSHWHEDDNLLYIDGRDVLGNSLTAFLRDKGVTGSARIDNLDFFTEETKALYQENIIDPHNEKKSEEFRQKLEAAVEPHGPLTSVSYNRSSHGMMAGTGSSSHQEIAWKEDGSIIYTSTSSFSGQYTEFAYKIKPEIAQKMIDLVEEQKLAALTKLDIPTPLAFDNFTSSTISVVYDDRSVGGEYYHLYTLVCGPAGSTFKSLEDEISALFEEMGKSGECIKNEMRENGQSPFTGLMGMQMMTGMIDMGGQPGHERPVEMMGMVQVDPDAGKSTDAQEKWTCKCGAKNSGKFCCECGEPKPAGWICECGHENTGKFCVNCGKPQPAAGEDGSWVCPMCKTSGNRGKFCAGCGAVRPADT